MLIRLTRATRPITRAALALAALAPLASSACSSRPEGEATSTAQDDLNLACTPLESYGCKYLGGLAGWRCGCSSVVTEAPAPACGVPVPVPPALAPYGCVPGVKLVNAIFESEVWACSGLGSTPAPLPITPCTFENEYTGCQLLYQGTTVPSAPCNVGSADPGWTLVEVLGTCAGGCQ